MTNTNRALRVFLCHSSNDKPAVRELYQKLRAETWLEPWLDEEELYPGQDWNFEIEKAVEAADVILVCLSQGSTTKEGYVQREIRIALDYADYKPEGTLYVIPVRLEECEPPRRLRVWQYADYFEGQRERGLQRLLVSLKRRAVSLGLKIETPASKENIGYLPEGKVFVSYAWGDEEIVNQIIQSLQKRGLKIIRDKRDLQYEGFNKGFMERIGQVDCVIVVISDKYLRSPNCMFELVEIAGNKQFENRIFPVVLADADIYKIKGKLQYIKHWEDQIKEVKELLKGVDPTNLVDIYEQLYLYDRIRDNISRLTSILKDMNAFTPDMHQESNFGSLYDAIEEKIKG